MNKIVIQTTIFIVYFQAVFALSATDNVLPLIEEFRLGDTIRLKDAGALEGIVHREMDSLTKAKIHFWFRSDVPDNNQETDSAKLFKLGYSVKPKTLFLDDTTSRQGFDLYRGKKCIADNLLRFDPLPPVEIDTIHHAYILVAHQYKAGKLTGTFIYNDKIMFSDNLGIFWVFPKLYKGKPLYIARSPSVNKTDSITFFNLSYSDFSGNESDPKFNVQYSFDLMIGAKVMFRFDYAFKEYLALFPEAIDHRTYVFNDSWAFELKNQMVINGVDVAKKNAYSECFDSWHMKGKPFFFFKKDDYYGIHYGNESLSVHYDRIFHDGCCSSAMLNPCYSEKAAFFYALKGDCWYYVVVHW